MIRQLVKLRPRGAFRTRSPERDIAADNVAISSIASVIAVALKNAEAERDGLKSRLDDVLSRAAIVAGNDTDEYVHRDAARSKMLTDSDTEIRIGQFRLTSLEQNISHFKFLKVALQTRFPHWKESDPEIG